MILFVIIDLDYGIINKLEFLLLNNCFNLEVRGFVFDFQYLDYCLINLKFDLVFVYISFVNVFIFCVLEYLMELVFLFEVKLFIFLIILSVMVRYLYLYKFI